MHQIQFLKRIGERGQGSGAELNFAVHTTSV